MLTISNIYMASDNKICISIMAKDFVYKFLFDLRLTSLSTFFSHIATVSGCSRELNAHF